MLTSHFDYSVFTIPVDIEDLSYVTPLFEPIQQLRRNAFYDIALKLKCGGLLWYGGKQGSKVELTGEPLERLRESGFGDADLLNTFSDWKPTRLDYCFTTDKGSLSEVNKSYDTGGTFPSNKSVRCPYFDGKDKGATFYVGYKSKNMVRIYDKAKELKLLAQCLNRVELQTRERYARALFHESRITGNPPMVARSMMKARFTTDVDWVNECLEGDLCNVSLEPVKKGSMERWIYETVQPALYKYSDQYGTNKLVDFLNRVAKRKGITIKYGL